MEVNEKCDVYSFGVLTFEILFGKHPGDILYNSFQSSGVSLTLDVTSLIDELDQRLPHPTNVILKEVVSIIKITIACLNVNPRCRPIMEEVCKELVIFNSS